MGMVPEAGLEPAFPFGLGILSPFKWHSRDPCKLSENLSKCQ